METVTLIIIIVLVGIILLISLYYSILAASKIASIKNYASDPALASAHRLLSWTSSILIITFVLIIIGIIILFVEGAEFIPSIISYLSTIFIFLIFAASITIGIIAAIAAVDINSSPLLPNNLVLKAAYHDTIIAAVVALGATGLLFIGYILSWWSKRYVSKQQTKIQEQQQQQQTNQQIYDLYSRHQSHQHEINNLKNQLMEHNSRATQLESISEAASKFSNNATILEDFIV